MEHPSSRKQRESAYNYTKKPVFGQNNSKLNEKPKNARTELKSQYNNNNQSSSRHGHGNNPKKDWRISIIKDTMNVCQQLEYKFEDSIVSMGDPASILRDIDANVVYSPEALSKLRGKYSRKADGVTQVSIRGQDCLEVALELQQKGFNPAVLNMASHKRPGGGYLNGAGAQEENLFRRSNYFQHLENPKTARAYPMYGGIYSPNVLVFRASEEDRYEYLPAPVPVSFIAVAAFAHPKLVKVLRNGQMKMELDDFMAEKTKEKIRYMLNIGLEHGHDSLVLSAFGCGAFCNPPEHIAKLFQEVIRNEYEGLFKHISFAILDDHNAHQAHNPLGNIKPFQIVFAK